MVKPSSSPASSPTSKDVALLAGVSRSIVSGVLNGTMSTMRVSAGTRERVFNAAQELGYTPNPVAQALRRKRSNVIGFVPRIDRNTPFDSPVPFLLGGHLAQASLEHRYHIVEAGMQLAARGDPDEIVQVLVASHVDGVVLDSPVSIGEVTRFSDRGLPVVQVIRPHRAALSPSVTIDTVPGMTAAIEHFLEMGHRKIAFIGSSGEHAVDRSRVETFRRVLERAELPAIDEWIVLVDTYDPRFGRLAAKHLLNAQTRPTALFVAGDNLASGALQYFYEHHIRIPDDLSVISYDDIFAAYLIPALTSVNQPLAEAASRAIELLIARIGAPPDAHDQAESVSLPTHLVKRHSVRRIRPRRAWSGESRP